MNFHLLIVVYIILATSSSSNGANETTTENGDDDRYEKISNTYFDKIDQKLYFRLRGGGKGFLSEVEDNSTAECPPNSKIVLFWRNYELKACECINGFTPSAGYRRCVPAKTYSDSCDASNPCSSHAALMCLNGTCQCHPRAVWDEQDSFCYSSTNCEMREHGTVYYQNALSRNKCIRVVDSPCDPTKTLDETACPENSICGLLYEEISMYACKCKDGFTSNSHFTKCLRAGHIGDSCDGENVICLNGLECLNNTVCGCRGDLVWDNENCRLPAGKPCVRFTSPWCVRNSECKHEGEGVKMACMCQRGYTRMDDGICHAKHAGSCAYSQDCEPDLECIDGLCNCPAPANQIYAQTDFEKNSSRCRGLPETPCSSASSCTTNAACVFGTCKCVAGYSKSWTRQCIKSFQARCNKGDCNINEGLACINGVCACFDPNLTFVNETGCVGKIGSPCGNLPALKASDCPRYTLCSNYFVSCEPTAICNFRGFCESQSQFGLLDNQIPAL